MGRGPERLLESGLGPLLLRLGHKFTREEVRVPGPRPTEISTTFELCNSVATRVRECLEFNVFPLILSGNFNIAIGSIARCGSEQTGVAWFDAHGESTAPETTESGFLDGMGISILTGACWRKLAGRIPNFSPVPGNHVLLIGSRDVERAEIDLLDRMGVHRVTDLEYVLAKIEAISRRIEGVYVHVDLDVVDPKEAVANQWTPPGGLTVEKLTQALREIRRHAQVKGLGIPSYDPELDRDQNAAKAACAVAGSILCAAE